MSEVAGTSTSKWLRCIMIMRWVIMARMEKRKSSMVDLTTTYLGLHLKNPLVASASPLSKKVDSAVQLEQSGVSAIVMYSLFEEQIIQESLKLNDDLTRGAESYGEALSYLPDYGMYSIGPERYLELISRIKKAVSIPVIGSLNGATPHG